jgi:predicted glycosyltransferase
MACQGKIAFYSHDTMGLGHLRRCLKMAAAITDRLGTQDGLILTGSPWSNLLTPPPGFRFVSLPPVIKTGPSEYQSRDPALSLDDVIARRRAVLEGELVRFAPQLLVVDNVPCGLGGEILPALVALRRLGTCIVLSLRDVLDEDEAIRKEWDAAGAIPTLVGLYDEIWLFGDRDSATYNMIPPRLQDRTVVCGHLGELGLQPGSCAHESRRAPRDSKPAEPEILVTGGGGGDAGVLVETYVAALRQYRPAARTRIVLGPEFPAEQVPQGADLGALGVTLVKFEDDMGRAIHDADVVVSMAGYNTVCEVLAVGRRMVLVPRVWPRREQLIRASELARHGRAEVIHPYALTPGSLWGAVERALSQPAAIPSPQVGGQRVGQRAFELLPALHAAAAGAV